ncbi:MAG: hypothetical protein V3S39_07635 [Thermodesulfobacteriota bacterium]
MRVELKVAFLLVLTYWLAFMIPAFAQGLSASLAIQDINRRSAAPEGARAVKAELASQFGVSVSVVDHQQRQSKLGLGEIAIANALAQQSGKSFDEIAALFKAGPKEARGWGKLARDLGVNLGQAVSAVQRISHRAEEGMTTGRPVEHSYPGVAGSQRGGGGSFRPGMPPDRGFRRRGPR